MVISGHLPHVDPDRCTGCGRCVAACTLRLFTLDSSNGRKHAAMTNPESCTRCMKCAAACPVEAIS